MEVRHAKAWVELGLVLTTAALHFVFQTALHLDGPYIVGAVLFWTGCLVYRLRTPGQARAWGLRSDTLAASLKANGAFLFAGGLAMVGYGLSPSSGSHEPTGLRLD